MTHNKHDKYRERIAEQAADWFACMQDPEHSEADRAAFAQWLQASKLHVEEYLQADALWGDMRELGPDPEIEQLIDLARADSEDENIVSLFHPSAHRQQSSVSDQQSSAPAGNETGSSRDSIYPKSKSSPVWFAAAASVLVAVLAINWFNGQGPEVYQTAVGEQASFTLEDGSTLSLNTRTRVEVSYSVEARDISITSGEALFDVSKDPNRPFRVKANETIVQAVGTSFNVRRRNKNVSVTVAEGIVEVKSALSSKPLKSADESGDLIPLSQVVRLVQGQQAKIDSRSKLIAVSPANLDSALAWQERRLIFEGSPLSDVVEDFNLYNHTKLMIADPDLETLKISGSFKAKNWQSFIKYLEASHIASVTKDTNGRQVVIQKLEAEKVKGT